MKRRKYYHRSLIQMLLSLNALQTVHLYEEQQQEGLQGVIQALNYLENEIGRRQLYIQKQQDIRSYFAI